MWFTRVSINNPVFATMVMVAIMVLGLFSYMRLPVEQMPDISIPVAVIGTPYPGASAKAVEQDVSRPIEEAINTVSGIKTLRSSSREGYSWVVAEFELSVDIKTAVQDVRDKVAEARRGFNKNVGEPTVTRADNDNDQPLIYLSIGSDSRSLRELSDLADRLVVKRLQGAPGVGNIDVNGAVQREMSILLDPEKLAAFGIGVDQVVAAIQMENQDAPAGALASKTSEKLVRVVGKLKSVESFENIIVGRTGTGTATAPVKLGQIATIRDGQKEEDSIATENGKRVISLQIRKTHGANTIEMAEGIRKQVDTIKQSLPADIRLNITEDDSEFIKDGVDNVRHTIIEGALLTVFIVFLFLHSWRSTVITGLTLPISVFAAFIALYAFGFTLNFITLLALSLSIGILIDDAIVVRENIVRHVAMGKSHRAAALEATQEIGLAVMATSFTIVAVFLPVAFMGGIIGKFFYQFGITVVVSVLVSLFVSFTLDPMLSSLWRDRPSKWMAWGPIKRMLDGQQRFIDWLHAVYDKVLRWSLNWRKLTLAGVFAIFVASFFLVPFIGSEFVPDDDNESTNVRIQTPIGSSLEYTNTKAQQVEATLREIPEIKRISKYVNKTGAWFDLEIGKKKDRKRGKKDIDDDIRGHLAKIAGLDVGIGWNRPIQVYILGPDIAELDRISQQVIKKMKAIKGIVDIDSSYKPTTPTLDVVVNRDLASDLGVSMGQITATTRAMIGGEPSGQWEGPDGENHQILVRLPQAERVGSSDMDRIYVASSTQTPDGAARMVPLRQIAEFKPSFAERQIDRRSLQRQIRIFTGVSKDANVGDVSALLRESIKDISLPPGYQFQFGGSSQDMQESMGYAVAALALGVVFIYLILASQFGSYLQPVAIMASLPLSLIGVLLALLIFGSTLNLFSVIGFIMLMGLVTKNAILLVDFTNHGMREGLSRNEAILQAGQVRLRPILMTTAAMIGGMMPLALALGPGSEQQSPMAHAVIGGIVTSTLFTLVVVPVLFTYFDAWGRKAKSWLLRNEPQEHGSGAAAGGHVFADKHED
jgi:multidrug efflux pump subunit AcrB